MKSESNMGSAPTFLATTNRGLARATCDTHGEWTVAITRAEQDVGCLAADPFDAMVLYAGTNGNGVLRSHDGGVTWSPAGLTGVWVKSLAASPSEPGVLYAGARPPQIYRSQDYGATWRELGAFRRVRRWYWLSPAEPPSLTAYVLGLSVSPTDPNTIVAGIEAGAVVRSVDGGQTWQGHRKKADRDCHWLAFHATDGNWVYEAGGGGPAYSRDGGQTWLHPTKGLHGRYCMACAADPARPDIWYVSAAPMFSWQFIPQAHIPGDARAAIYRSISGRPWEKLSGGLPPLLDYMPYALLTDPSAPGHLYAGLANGEVWHATEHGDRWQRLPFMFQGIHRSLVMF